ncbi:PIN domain-containing protein [Halorubrum sp. SY-15]|uniref:PIN domain-containing protein n=1 Tax=Halorubrum sp. SY-15 TaxID=3402277 RepID=UPI003EB71439
MKVVFDAEPLIAFAFDEPGAGAVEDVLDGVYDGEIDGYVTTVNLAEFRYVAARLRSPERADAHIEDLKQMGVTEYAIDDVWKLASELKAVYSPSLGDAYAVAATKREDNDGNDVTLLVGADDDYDDFEETDGFTHLIERFRDTPP